MPWPQRVEQVAILERRLADDFKAARESRFGTLFLSRGGVAFTGLPLWLAAYDLGAQRVAIAALAVERYRRAKDGAVRASLDTLVPAYLRAVPDDPFSGKLLVYTRVASGYRIYSVDNDRIDDGGVLRGRQPRAAGGARRHAA